MSDPLDDLASAASTPSYRRRPTPPAAAYLKAWHIGIAVGVVLFIAAVFAVVRDKPPLQVQTAPSARVVPIKDLVGLYDANELRGDNLYLGKRFCVHGVIDSVEKNIVDVPYVVLADSGRHRVRFSFDKSQASLLTSLSKGQSITIEGKCYGVLLDHVMMRDSNIRE